MWVMGMALEEDERTATRERAERTVEKDAEKMVHDAAQDLESKLRGTAARNDCLYGPVSPTVILEMRETVPMDSETPQALGD